MENISHRMAVTMFKTAGDVVNLTVLKDAERKIVVSSCHSHLDMLLVEIIS